ncbi:MAG: hypothetical protein ACK5XN_23410 [Bacteroidota bacterium]|jgi:uncharacterized protein YoxC
MTEGSKSMVWLAIALVAVIFVIVSSEMRRKPKSDEISDSSEDLMSQMQSIQHTIRRKADEDCGE